MSRLTSKEVANMMEAYSAVYAPQEITEEQVWEQVEEWVNSLVEEGYDLSEYTWEEMYEAYIEEQGRSSAGVSDPQVQARWRAIGNTLAYGNAEGRRPSSSSRPTNLRGGRRPAPQVSNIPPSEGTGKPGSGRLGNISPNEGTGRGGPSDIKAKPSGSAPAPATARPSGAAPSGGKPAAAAAPAAKPTPAAQTGDKAKDTATWAKANPKLAAASAERERTRGTSASTNPLMKGFKSKLPSPAPSSTSNPYKDTGAAASAVKSATTPSSSTAKSTPTSSSSTLSNLAKKAAGPTSFKAEGYDVFDVVISHLLDEGYADTEEAALAIMTNMSEEWRENIIEADSIAAMRERAAKRRKQRYGASDTSKGGRDDFRPYTEDDYKRGERKKDD